MGSLLTINEHAMMHAGPGLLKLFEAHPRFAEDLSRRFFREYPELLSKVSRSKLTVDGGRIAL